jgi:hypothetical protein
MTDPKVETTYILIVDKKEDREHLRESQRRVLSREYPTFEVASRIGIELEKDWGIHLTVKQPFTRPGYR